MSGMMRMKIGRYLLAMLAVCMTGLAPVHATEQVTIYLTDALGTPVVEMNGQGEVINRSQYRPYGKQTQGSGEAGPGFTGHVNDPDTGLVYMQARYYDPVSGRFLSPDPLGPAPSNIFSFNRYAYANDNPIVNTDPTGMVSDGDCSAACVFMRRVSDKMSSMASSIMGNTASHANPTSPTGQLDMANGYANAGIAQAGASAAAGSAPVADLVPGATLAACASGIKCGRGDLAIGVLAVIPGEGEVISGGATAVRIGREGEGAVRAAFSIGDATKILINDRGRIPDGLTANVISEVKNVKSLSFTRQLRDFGDFAQKTGRRYDLYVRPNTRLSGPLQKAIITGSINLRYIP